MLNKKRILFTIGSFESGGAELHLANLLPKLKEIGYNVTLLSLSDKGNLKKVFWISNSHPYSTLCRRVFLGFKNPRNLNFYSTVTDFARFLG